MNFSVKFEERDFWQRKLFVATIIATTTCSIVLTLTLLFIRNRLRTRTIARKMKAHIKKQELRGIKAKSLSGVDKRPSYRLTRIGTEKPDTDLSNKLESPSREAARLSLVLALARNLEKTESEAEVSPVIDANKDEDPRKFCPAAAWKRLTIIVHKSKFEREPHLGSSRLSFRDSVRIVSTAMQLQQRKLLITAMRQENEARKAKLQQEERNYMI